MSTQRLSGYGLRRALIAGIQRIVARRDEIDRCNVWPVADHDTGTNLAYTFGVVLQALREARPSGVGEILQLVASNAADNGRGNAGAILAQFFHGVADSATTARWFTPRTMAEAAARGSTLARSAMAEPCDGTILTVIGVFAVELHQQAGGGDLRGDFTRALERTREALLQTRRQIPAMRVAGVPDAGALGFVTLLEGISEYIERGRALPLGRLPAELVTAGVEISRPGPGGQRYHVECVLEAGAVDRTGLKASLQALSLSTLVITGTREQVRVHARVDDPDEFRAIVARFGALSRVRIEDLIHPNPPGGAHRPRVAIVTDTGAELPPDEVARLGIHLVPQRLSVDGRNHVDRLSITPRELYQTMRNSPSTPRTSQPPPGDFRRLFEFLLTRYESVIDVSLGQVLSGTCQAAEGAAARVDRERVQVFDTGNVSTGQGLLTLWAAEAALAGLAAPDILAGLGRMRSRTVVYAAIRDIRYAVRGGRLPKAALIATRLLRITLTLTVRPTGRLGLGGILWTGRNLPGRFARAVAGRLDPARRYRVIISHCDCADDARQVDDALRASGRNFERVWVVETGAAIGAHAGPGSLVIGVQDYEAPAP